MEKKDIAVRIIMNSPNPDIPGNSLVTAMDISVFDAIPTQTTQNDRLSLLALQNAVAETYPSYCYLETGSFLGGTIQPHILDQRCRHIYSIDSRPASQPDERGISYDYPGDAGQQMLDNLKQLAPDRVRIVTCIDTPTDIIPPGKITDKPDLCFIDGEHTNRAALQDALFALQVCAGNAVICFHDAHVVNGGISSFLACLNDRKRKFQAAKLPGSVFAVAMDSSSIFQHECLNHLISNPQVFLATSRIRMGLHGMLPRKVRQILHNLYSSCLLRKAGSSIRK